MEKDKISNDLEKNITIKNEILSELFSEYQKVYLERELSRLFNDFINGKQQEMERMEKYDINSDICNIHNRYKGYLANNNAIYKFMNSFDKNEYLLFESNFIFLLDKQLLVLELNPYHYNFNKYGINANTSMNIRLIDIPNGCKYAYRNGPTYNNYLNEYYENGVTINLIDNNNNIILGPIYGGEFMFPMPKDENIYNKIKQVSLEFIISKFTDNKNNVKKKTYK